MVAVPFLLSEYTRCSSIKRKFVCFIPIKTKVCETYLLRHTKDRCTSIKFAESIKSSTQFRLRSNLCIEHTNRCNFEKNVDCYQLMYIITLGRDWVRFPAKLGSLQASGPSPAMLHECRRVMFGCLRVNIFFSCGPTWPSKVAVWFDACTNKCTKNTASLQGNTPARSPVRAAIKTPKKKSRGASHAKGWLLHGAITCMSHLARLVEPRTCNQSRP